MAWVEPHLCENCTALQTVVLPAVMTEVPRGLLRGCTELRRVTVQGAVTAVGDGAFSGCPALRRVRLEFENADTVTVGEALLDGAPSGLYLYVSESAFPSFAGNYNWYEYSDRIKREK